MFVWQLPTAADASRVTWRVPLDGLPPTAAALYTLMTVGPSARQPLFWRVTKAAEEVDIARTVVMATVTDLPAARRSGAILVAQTASLLASLMVATARVAAHGRPGALPEESRQLARVVVELTDQVVLSIPRPRSGSNPRDDDVDFNRVHQRLVAVSRELDDLMASLTSGGAPLGE